MFDKYSKWIETHRERLINISDKIWGYAEIGLEEEKSSALLISELEQEGFIVEKGVAAMPTAFYASYGEGKPVIAILGEYDALPGLSQDSTPDRKPLEEGAPGHGCGHNLLGVGALGGVFAVKQAIDDNEVSGTIRYYGCPAEESFNAKGYMVNAGLFEDVDISLTWHPGFLNMLNVMSALSVNSVIFKFHGKTAHAAGDPQNGRSALDAVELMNIGANYMREHMISEARIHYVITNGGKAPNIVPDEAEVWYFVRAPKRHQVENLYERLKKIAQGAALMTETELEIDFLSGTFNTEYNKVVQDVVNKKLNEIGAPKFNAADKKFAKELLKNVPSDTIEGYLNLVPPDLMDLAKAVLSQPLNKIIIPPLGEGKTLPGSTDVADVSWVTPLAEFLIACEVMGSPGHSWQNVATSGMSIGHKGMLTAAKILTLSALEFMKNPKLVDKAWKQFKKDRKESQYRSPFPEGLQPPFHRLKN
ncbi:MAG: amidohydrolase [Candidatus Lokiarchaeota archaeon]|nr:amidohydrolase [Candidatus Lokiarchaeota archaeon]MBD3199362.1 amidohydrolase [Candidatus Lokiarchaeota archaeon]